MGDGADDSGQRWIDQHVKAWAVRPLTEDAVSRETQVLADYIFKVSL